MKLHHPKLELHFRQLGWKRDAGIPIPAIDNNSDSGNWDGLNWRILTESELRHPE